MKKLKLRSAVEVDGKLKSTSRTFSNIKEDATDEALREGADAIGTLVSAKEKEAYRIDEVKL
ncbi:MAG: DUF1659 domain-containing protein [Finegoldia sp.]|nr:DUF1659 domain-containing protein [Finegoldia sp.]